jgi:hypothetical protein
LIGLECTERGASEDFLTAFPSQLLFLSSIQPTSFSPKTFPPHIHQLSQTFSTPKSPLNQPCLLPIPLRTRLRMLLGPKCRLRELYVIFLAFSHLFNLQLFKHIKTPSRLLVLITYFISIMSHVSGSHFTSLNDQMSELLANDGLYRLPHHICLLQIPLLKTPLPTATPSLFRPPPWPALLLLTRLLLLRLPSNSFYPAPTPPIPTKGGALIARWMRILQL